MSSCGDEKSRLSPFTINSSFMMKLQILSSIFFAAALAFPLEADTDVQKSELTLRDIRDIGATTVHTSDESAQALPALEKRLDLRTCKRVGKQILKIGTSTAT